MYTQLDLTAEQLETLSNLADRELNTNSITGDMQSIHDEICDCSTYWAQEIVDEWNEQDDFDEELVWDLEEAVKQAINGAYAYQKAQRMLDNILL